jgi:hypothetical protein
MAWSYYDAHGRCTSQRRAVYKARLVALGTTGLDGVEYQEAQRADGTGPARTFRRHRDMVTWFQWQFLTDR